MDMAVLVAAKGGVGTVTLNRPATHNAFDDAMIARLTSAFRDLAEDPQVRMVVLRAEGASFSAGGDLGWMKAMAGYSQERNVADARALADLMSTLDRLPKPTVALVQGSAYGGGVGLVACCDIAIVADSASFSLSEVRLGLIPAAIGPYVIAAIGARAARRYMLTGERFDAAEALRLGLAHEVAPPYMLEATLERVLADLAAGGPFAQANAKDLIRLIAPGPDDALIEETAQRIADLRASPEGREGIGAFLEKRAPAWRL